MNSMPPRTAFICRIVVLGMTIYALSFLFASYWTNSSPGQSIFTNTKLSRGELVLVPGHSVLLRFGATDFEWDLSTIQRQTDQGPVLTRHVWQALEYAKADNQRVVVFSGGQTHENIGPISEGFSYYQVAKSLLGEPASSGPTVSSLVAEEFARDSYENLLFSICRYKEWTGFYPAKIVVFGFGFKKDRFVKLHREAIGFPENSFQYRTGSDNFSEATLKEIMLGEHSNAYGPYLRDAHGCHPPLSTKRQSRDPFRRHHGSLGYRLSCPELAHLFTKCSDNL